MEKQIQNIQNEMIQEFQEYSKTYILNIIETLVTNNMLWRCYSYSGWNILKTMDIKYEIESLIKKDLNFIKNKLLLVNYCYKHNYPLDILKGIQTSLFLRKVVHYEKLY